MTVHRILLVNPPIYDFAAYDFWLKPYGLLSVAGYLRGQADFAIFDYLDRLHPFMVREKGLGSDRWGRGRFYCEQVAAPACLAAIPRYFRRFGLPREIFRDFLEENGPFDFVLVQTTMTYWYPGVQEVIEDVRRMCRGTKVVLGGNYVTVCTDHAERLGADLLVRGSELASLWELLATRPDLGQPALWEVFEKVQVGVLKLSEGCPFNCTYCSVPEVYGKFKARPLERSVAELRILVESGVRNIAFYDDALLFNAEDVLIPFLHRLIELDVKVNLHSPNALNARLLSRELAELMIRANVKTFYIGFESVSSSWQRKTGSKVFCNELARTVEFLIGAGADPAGITAYQILGHPQSDIQELEESMRFVADLGIRGMLADFSPIPGTPDGQACGRWVDMDEPLMHNKTAFPIIRLGFDETNRLKDLQRQLNRGLVQEGAG